MPESNWNELKQSLINDVADFKNQFIKDATNDIIDRLKSKGLDGSRIEKEGNKVFYNPPNQDDFNAGKIYFEEVYQDISNPGWVETI